MNEKILVVGAGHQGLAMAAHLALNGEKVNLWNRSDKTVKEILVSKTIHCKGCIEGEAKLEAVSTNIEDVIEKVIMVSTPSFAYKNIAKMLAPVIQPDSIVVLNPGRTFGAIEFIAELKKSNCRHIPYVAETQSIIYTCRKMDTETAWIYALKKDIKMACANGNVKEVSRRIPECMRNRFLCVDDFLQTSLSNVGMILHCAPVLLNVGWIESKIHKFEYYYDGISVSVANVLEKMDRERVNVAEKLGVKVESLVEWFKSAYGVEGTTIYDCIQKNNFYRGIDAPLTLEHRYLDEDVPNGLVPIEFLGKQYGIDVSTITQIIDLAILVRGVDFRESGRRFSILKRNGQFQMLDSNNKIILIDRDRQKL